jgi:hypothetical protein
MKKTQRRGIVYKGVWEGLGKIYNIWVEGGYTTIIVKPGEDLKQRSREIKVQFASKAGRTLTAL